MTTLPEALANPVGQLAPFENRDVLRSTVAVTNAGDGLSEAMKFDPIELHHGDTCYLVLECEVTKVRFDPIKDTNALSRVHVLRAGTATLVDGELVAKHLDEQKERIAEAKRISQGTPNLDDHVDQMVAEHEAGEHSPDLVDGCPTCEEERDLAARGQ